MKLAADDRPARQKALDGAASFIVQAPAGSGKTGLLTLRFLHLLALVEQPEEILAITFTRKAAGEMRDRIVEALESAQSPPPPEHDTHAYNGWRAASAALQQDRTRGWRLLANPARLQVLTIDSLCSRLAARLPVLSGFGSLPETTEDASEMYLEAARRTFASIYDESSEYKPDLERLLLHRDSDLQTLQGLLAQLLAGRDRWLRPIGNLLQRGPNQSSPSGSLADPKAARKELEGALKAMVEDHLQRLRTAFPEELLWRACASAAFAAERHPDPQSPVQEWRGWEGRFPSTEAQAVAQWCGLAELFLTSEGSWRKRLTKNQGFPAANQALTKDQKAEFKAAKDEALALLETLSDDVDLARLLHQSTLLPPPHYSDEQWAIIGSLLRLAILAAGHLLVVFAEQNRTDFSEVARRAEEALGEESAPSELAMSYDARLSHILIDEFQDTSIGQLALLKRLTAGWSEGEGRTLFLVGDPMQSIYRFRDAEVGLFLQIRRQGLPRVHPLSLLLTSNFRSDQRLVGWFNQTFGAVFPERENPLAGGVPYELARPARPDRGAEPVELHPIVEADSNSLEAKRSEATRVVQIVEQTWNEDAQRRIAILVRARSHLEELLPMLRRQGYRYRGVDLEALSSRPVVRDLTSLTRALLHPADRLAWLSVLRSPWCGLKRSSLLVLAEQEVVTTLQERWSDPEALARLEPEEAQRLQRTVRALEPALAQRQRLSARRMVEGCWVALGGPACLTTASEREDAEAFFRLLEQLSRKRWTLEELEKRLQKLYASPDSQADDRLSIMTIHKAKGLQFDTVILPGLSRSGPSMREPLLSWLELPDGQGGSHLLLAPISEKGSKDKDRVYRYLRSLEQEKEANESTRVLYVAATRAERKLHLVARMQPDSKDPGSLKEPTGGSFLGLLWPSLGEQWNARGQGRLLELQRQAEEALQAAGGTSQPEPSVPRPQRLTRLPLDWERPELPDDVRPGSAATASLEELDERPSFDWAGETARAVGTVVHRVLQQMGRDGLRAWDERRVRSLEPYIERSLHRSGLAGDRLRRACERAVRALLATLEHPLAHRALAATGALARSEYAVSGLLAGRLVRGVVDRTFVDEDGVLWIVDYKTSDHQGGDREGFLDSEQVRYRPQLERYARLLGRKSERAIRLALYFPLLDAWRQWDFRESGDEPHLI